jgi:hypothetical protein
MIRFYRDASDGDNYGCQGDFGSQALSQMKGQMVAVEQASIAGALSFTGPPP